MDGAQLGGGEFQPKRTEIVATMQARFLGSKYTKMISRPGLLWEAYNASPTPNSGAIRGGRKGRKKGREKENMLRSPD